MTKKAAVEVFNVTEPALTQPFPFWVCSVVGGKLWFYGAYRTRERAEQVLTELTDDGVSRIIVERMEGNAD